MKTWDSGFQTTLFLSVTRPLSRPVGEGWREGGSTGQTNLILPQAIEPPPS
ncbi:hypothetical protein ACMYUL_04785 [Neisseria sp. CP9]|uniref:hypothetical protein n=1 Tax=unclassified Neisseria TaxID=2623750 RepID=UPI00143A1578|nr:hypothetical protein [Neisseria sp. HMSC077D05]